MIADLCIKHDILCFSDEVYEWITYKGHQHIKIGIVAVAFLLLVKLIHCQYYILHTCRGMLGF